MLSLALVTYSVKWNHKCPPYKITQDGRPKASCATDLPEMFRGAPAVVNWYSQGCEHLIAGMSHFLLVS